MNATCCLCQQHKFLQFFTAFIVPIVMLLPVLLQGPVPAALGELKALQVLVLSWNELSGEATASDVLYIHCFAAIIGNALSVDSRAPSVHSWSLFLPVDVPASPLSLTLLRVYSQGAQQPVCPQAACAVEEQPRWSVH